MTGHGAWGVRKDMTLAEFLRFLSDGFHDGTDTQRALWAGGQEIDRLNRAISEAHSKIDTLRESMRLDAETIAAKDRRIAELERQPDDAVTGHIPKEGE